METLLIGVHAIPNTKRTPVHWGHFSDCSLILLHAVVSAVLGSPITDLSCQGSMRQERQPWSRSPQDLDVPLSEHLDLCKVRTHRS